MYKKKKILALIPARGGSKGVPRKNIKLLAGRPLIFYVIDAAGSSRYVDKVIVSTDDKEIARIARDLNAEAPFIRPAELALDDTPDWPVFHHAVSFLENKMRWSPEVVVHLRPTSPFVKGKDIDAAISRLVDTGADGVRTVNRVRESPYHMQVMSEDGKIRPLIKNIYGLRQNLPVMYTTNGMIDATWRETIMENGKMLNLDKDIRGLEIEQYRGLELDTELDFFTAEQIISHESRYKIKP